MNHAVCLGDTGVILSLKFTGREVEVGMRRSEFGHVHRAFRPCESCHTGTSLFQVFSRPFSLAFLQVARHLEVSDVQRVWRIVNQAPRNEGKGGFAMRLVMHRCVVAASLISEFCVESPLDK